MEYIILARDGTDSEAQARRQKARPEHLKLSEKLRAEGKHLFAAAMLDDAEQMIGSIIAVDFESRAELDYWLTIEPYVTGKAWEQIDIIPCRVGPSFRGAALLKSNSPRR